MISLGDYWFDEEAASKPVRFIERYCTHIKGRLAGQPLKLEEWQREFIREFFGWKRPDGTRRYRIAYLEVPRKNGKSTLASGLSLFLLCGAGEGGARVFSAASTRDQASLVFDDAMHMVNNCEPLKKGVDVKPAIKVMRYTKKNGEYRAISADAHNAHGLNPSGIVFDEVHTQKTRHLWDALQTGLGAREQPVTLAITTAGHDRNSICYELHQYAIKVRDGVVNDPTFLPWIYAADQDDDWTAEETWQKANPNYGISIRPEFLREECERAKKMPSYENTFRQLYLNQWTEQATRFIPMRDWDQCKAEQVDLRGERCWIGIDLGSTRDITALAMVFPRSDGSYWVVPEFFIPQEAADKRSESDGRQFNNAFREFMWTTPGRACDYGYVHKRILELREIYDLQEIAFDPWNATQFEQDLEHDGLKLVKFRQSMANFAAPVRFMETLIVEHKLRHDGNPVLRWMASNMAVRSDASGNLRPDKENSGDKIDGIVAMLMGLAIAKNQQTTEVLRVW